MTHFATMKMAWTVMAFGYLATVSLILDQPTSNECDPTNCCPRCSLTQAPLEPPLVNSSSCWNSCRWAVRALREDTCHRIEVYQVHRSAKMCQCWQCWCFRSLVDCVPLFGRQSKRTGFPPEVYRWIHSIAAMSSVSRLGLQARQTIQDIFNRQVVRMQANQAMQNIDEYSTFMWVTDKISRRLSV